MPPRCRQHSRHPQETRRNSTDPLVAHQKGQDVFASVLERVAPDRSDAPTPCSGWKVREVVAHVIAGNSRMAGSSPVEPTEWAALVEAFATSARAAQNAFAAPDGLTRSVEFPFGSVPGSVMAGMRATDLAAHAWDLARATGQPTDLDPGLAEELLAVARERLQPSFRGPAKPFAEEKPCDPSRPAAYRLAAFLGRIVE